MKRWIDFLSTQILEPTDVASVVVFRVGFGLLMFWEVTRYFYFGWVEELFAKPQFHFQYEWFKWVIPFPGDGMYLLFASLGILALMIAFGLFYRIAAILYFLVYTYVFLIDQATYNNHFYLICMLSFFSYSCSTAHVMVVGCFTRCGRAYRPAARIMALADQVSHGVSLFLRRYSQV